MTAECELYNGQDQQLDPAEKAALIAAQNRIAIWNRAERWHPAQPRGTIVNGVRRAEAQMLAFSPAPAPYPASWLSSQRVAVASLSSLPPQGIATDFFFFPSY